jgi:hypothetical protein
MNGRFVTVYQRIQFSTLYLQRELIMKLTNYERKAFMNGG